MAVQQPVLVEAPAAPASIPAREENRENALAPSAGDSGHLVQMFERWACDPNASVEKIERLMALWERTEARKAETLFNAAMSQAQAAMRSVATDATNPQTH